MDKFEKIGYTALGVVAIAYVIAMTIGMMSAMPYGLIGLVLFVGISALVIKVVRERANNTEDDYYAKKVEK